MSGTHCKYFLTFTIGRMHVSVSHKIDCQGPPTTQLTLSHIFLYHMLPILPVVVQSHFMDDKSLEYLDTFE